MQKKKVFTLLLVVVFFIISLGGDKVMSNYRVPGVYVEINSSKADLIKTGGAYTAEQQIEAVTHLLTSTRDLVPIEGIDYNVIDMVKSIISPLSYNVRVSVLSSANTSVNEYGDITFNETENIGDVAFRISKGRASNVVNMGVTVAATGYVPEEPPEEPSQDVLDVATAKSALESATISPVEGVNTSVVPMAQAIVDNAVSGVSVVLYSESHANISGTGAITYVLGTLPVTGNVTFSIIKNTIMDSATKSITVPVSTAYNDVQTAKNALYGVELNPVQGVNTSAITMVQSLVNSAVTGVTVSIVSSNNANVATNGTITYGVSAVSGTVTFRLTKGSATDTKILDVNVPAQQNLDSQDVATAKASVEDSIWAVKGMDTNIITKVQAIVDAVISGVTVAMPSESHSQIASNGDITYGVSQVTGNCTFSFTKNAANDTKVVSVTVPQSEGYTNLLLNPIFETNITSWEFWNSSIAWVGGRGACLPTAQWGNIKQSFATTAGHIYYYSAYLQGNTSNYISIGDMPESMLYCTSTSEQKLSGQFTAIASSHSFGAGTDASSGFITHYLDKCIVVDLTARFGEGNEPTVSWCDANITVVDGGAPASDATDVATAKSKLSASSPITCTEGIDSSILTKAQSLVNTVVSGVTVSIDSESHSQIASNGAITYGATQVTGNVTFRVTKNAATDTQVVSVVVPATQAGSGTSVNVVTNYGADNTYSNDASSAINNAINYISSLPSGGTVIVPAGTYKINNNSITMRSKVNLLMDANAILKTTNSSNFSVIWVGSGVNNITIQGGQIDGSAGGYSENSHVGINLYATTSDITSVTIKNVKIHNFNMDGIYVGATTTTSYCPNGFLIEGCEIWNCGRNGISIISNRNGIYRNNIIHDIGNTNTLTSTGAGFKFEVNESGRKNWVGENILLDGNECYNCHIMGIMLGDYWDTNSSGTFHPRSITILANNYMHDCATLGRSSYSWNYNNLIEWLSGAPDRWAIWYGCPYGELFNDSGNLYGWD